MSAFSLRPFFVYLATTNIHHPFTPAPQFKGTSDRGRYGDFIYELDWIVGGVLTTLDDMGVADNTLVIFTSDNGGMLNKGGQDAWQAGHRVPFIARWPRRIPANSHSDQLISQVDILATLAAIVKRPLGDGQGIDSVNQLETLTGSPHKALRDHLIVSPNHASHLVVRQGQWVYIPAQGEGGFQQKKAGDHCLGNAAALRFTGQLNSDISHGKILADAPPAQLYDLGRDPSQTTNIYNQHPDVVKRLHALLQLYRKKTGQQPTLGWIDNRQQ